jgi:membrane protein YdbS with pleckstrin-like domain
MDIRKIVRNLDDDEEVHGIYHQFPLAFIWQWIGGITVILSPFFFLYLVLPWGTIGSAILVLLFLIGFFWLFRTWRLWYFSILIMTDRRLVIVEQQGILDRSVSQVNLDKINDISYRKRGIIETSFNVGTLFIQIANSQEKIELENIRFPSKRQQELFGLQGDYVEESIDEFKEEDLFGIIKEIRTRVGERRWQRIQEGNWHDKKKFIKEVEEEDSGKARAIEQFFGGEDKEASNKK